MAALRILAARNFPSKKLCSFFLHLVWTGQWTLTLSETKERTDDSMSESWQPPKNCEKGGQIWLRKMMKNHPSLFWDLKMSTPFFLEFSAWFAWSLLLKTPKPPPKKKHWFARNLVAEEKKKGEDATFSVEPKKKSSASQRPHTSQHRWFLHWWHIRLPTGREYQPQATGRSFLELKQPTSFSQQQKKETPKP